MPFYRKPIWAWLYLLLILCVAVALLCSWLQQNRLDTDLTSLLPAEGQNIQAQQLAKVRMNQRMNRDMVVLLSSDSPDKTLAAAHMLQKKWQDSGVFEAVTGKIEPDVAALQANIQRLRLAVVSENSWRHIMNQPREAFARQAQALVNPFAERSVLPAEQDWLGLGNIVMHQASQDGPVFYNIETGWLNIDDGDTTWVLLRARLPEKAGLINIPDGLLALIEDTQAILAQQKVQVLMAGGAIFAAENKSIGERESQYMSILGMGLTFLLLLLLFRSLRILYLLLPLVVGVLFGMAATVALCGHIHILTLVVGTSLMGVLLDFPLHWLASGVIQQQWQRWQALHMASKAFLLSLIITLLGYAALLITPLPILQQTAIFSAAALISAFLFSLLCLPVFFTTTQARIHPRALHAMLVLGNMIIRCRQVMVQKRWPFLLVLLLLAGGLFRLDTHDDIRQWVNLSPEWLAQAQKIGVLTQTMPAGQYFVLQADNDDELLTKSHALGQSLQTLVAQKQLTGFQSLDQWITPLSIQKQRQQDIGHLLANADNWQDLTRLGIAEHSIQDYLSGLQQQPVQTISQSLDNDLATAWQDLYLGKMANGQVAALVSLSGVSHVAALQKLADNNNGIYFVNDLQALNQLFTHTRNQAIALKAASYLLAIVLLAYVFGWRKGWLLLAVPVLSSLFCLAIFAYAGWPLSLFAIFGLFLVTAIGMDYAIYVSISQMAVAERLAGVLLAATTTMISFAILGFSATPAIASFGRSVAFGVFFSMILALALLPRANNKGM
ncbi:MAG: MMPL family transporter [Snodgrassella sp.]|uniref:MMPL family transporter n=1 Tax=Snodgrassella sp. TaxID=2815304 RepID=UPI002587D1B3|nr:MMPL family transporter [Snodgrassella sp.]MCO6508290.1 MMPL family transporter [Snodgrassella sp.]MCO6521720.1 MMPL family transporter [Snodgrassella sp.]